MNDRYTRAMLTLIAMSTVSLAVTSLWNTPPVARAQSTPPRQKCVWTYINESTDPGVGADGTVSLKSGNWKKISDEGWKLKTAAVAPGKTRYMFERCE